MSEPTTVPELDGELRRIQVAIGEVGDAYFTLMSALGDLKADRYIQEAKDIIAIHDLEGWTDRKITMDVRGAEALVQPETSEALRKYYVALEASKGAKEKLSALQAELSAIQTRAGLLKTEASLIGYQ